MRCQCQEQIGVDEHYGQQNFAVGDLVMAYFHLEWVLVWAYDKYEKVQNFSHHREVGPNAHHLELSRDVSTPTVFNVVDPYRLQGEPPEPTKLLTISFTDLVNSIEHEIEDIMDVGTTEAQWWLSMYHLVRWRERSLTYATWISEPSWGDGEKTFFNALPRLSYRNQVLPIPGELT